MRKTLTAVYLALTASAVAYELSIRIFDRGNSEFAGLLSIALTLPMSLVVIWIAKAAFGVNPGDTDGLFVAILGLSVLANASLVWMVLRILTGPK